MKILCLGDSGIITDKLVNILARKNKQINHGLIFTADQVIDQVKGVGYYHTSLADVSTVDLHALAKCFDNIVMLDIPRNNWSSWKMFLDTFTLCCELEKNHIPVEFKQNKNIKNLLYFSELLENNKSFCIYPWVGFEKCTNSTGKNPTDINQIKERILHRKFVPHYCEKCYAVESMEEPSPRQLETMNIVAEQNIDNLANL